MKCDRCKSPYYDKINTPFYIIPYQYGRESVNLCRKCHHAWYRRNRYAINDPYNRKYDVRRGEILQKFCNWDKNWRDMVEFELNAKFHTKTDEPGSGCPEISIRHQHYIPITEELQEMISKACIDIPESEAPVEINLRNEVERHCLSCKSCDVCIGSGNNDGYCLSNRDYVNIGNVACEHYEPFM